MGYYTDKKVKNQKQLEGVRAHWRAVNFCRAMARKGAIYKEYRARRDRLIEAGLWDMPHIPPKDELLRLEAILDARQRRSGGMGSSDPSVD